MKKNSTYRLTTKLSAIFMMCALIWLTISTPYVFSGQSIFASQTQDKQHSLPATDEESNPANNTTEEKKPGNISLSEEYLHTHLRAGDNMSHAIQYCRYTNSGLYHAFHGEMLVPPPNAGC